MKKHIVAKNQKWLEKRNIQEDEILAEEVRKYPCLYDKSDSGYKERDRVKNAWKAVENVLGIEEGLYCYIIYSSFNIPKFYICTNLIIFLNLCKILDFYLFNFRICQAIIR